MLNFKFVEGGRYEDNGCLEITSDEYLNISLFERDYEEALTEIGSYSSWTSNGAPVVAKEYLCFNYNCIRTKYFSRKMVSNDELAKFVKEFTKVFERAVIIHERHQKEAELQEEQRKQKAAQNQAEIDKINDFLKNLNK